MNFYCNLRPIFSVENKQKQRQALCEIINEEKKL